MAVIFMERSEVGGMLWPEFDQAGSANSSITAGSWSTYSLRATSSATPEAALSTAVSEFYGQTRLYQESAFGSGDYVQFRSATPSTQVAIGVTAGGQLTLKRGTTVLATGSRSLSVARWYYLQWRVVINDSTGVFRLLIDGTEEFNLTSTDTRNDGALGTVDRVRFLSHNSTAGAYFDDFILHDTSGSANTSYPDNLGLEALMPSAAGDNTGLSRGGSDSGANWSQVEERPANDATDYVFDSVVNDYDLYNLPSTSFSTVESVALVLRAQKSDAGAANIAHMLKVDTDANGSADTENTGADVALSTSWTHHTAYYDQQPGPSSWSAAKVNALQAGAKVR